MADSPLIKPAYGTTNPSPDKQAAMPAKRFASVIGLNSDKEQYYRELHANAWPTIVDRIKKSNISNYSIHVGELDGKRYLFSYLEYTGTDFDTDMQAMNEDFETKRWWKETDPCQRRLDGTPAGEQWLGMEMVFLME